MKQVWLIIVVMCTSFSCKQNKETAPSSNPISIAEKIANAHGFNQWERISKMEFTFNIDRDSSHFQRAWVWYPKKEDVQLITATDTIRYNRKVMDSISIQADKSFINDKFWLLVPFQLVWDTGTSISTPITEEAPISKVPMHKITLTYSNEGGYTPGDAYDLYFKDDYIIKEWVFRRGNSETPSLVSTFENYKDFNGIKLALEHKKAEGNWNLNFTNVNITLE
ncbi:hypothetical protein [Snuella sedimenti]|uniref:Uncharacterized protein n=1 Tax=Snuella sedimenti TaxID=2798802 RepID=A0A8J7LXC1_9FLAO|nr:hypothetical protein [Snuella sedimenti]MBJ6366506.1 hypothetical protein [Snuella sedimenti]